MWSMWRAMLELLGDTNAHAPREAQAIMRIETALAKASLTRVQQRDPYNLFHKMDRAKLQELTPAFEWPRYLKATGLGELNEFNVTEPAFYKEVQTLLTATPMDDWKVYLRWHLVHCRAPLSGEAFRRREFRILTANICAARRNNGRAGNGACSTWITIWARRWARCSWSAPSARI